LIRVNGDRFIYEYVAYRQAMHRGIALFAAVAVVVGLAGVAAAGPVGTVIAQDDTGTEDEAPESNETTEMSPGERLSGVVGVQSAEISGEVESRAFEVGLDRAETPGERAEIVAQRLDKSEQRLAEVEQRQRELRERRDAGELSQGAFAARMAETAARAETVRRGANRSAVVAEELPDSVRADRGIGRERVESVSERASGLSGPEVVAIARGVAGTDVGGPIAADRRGPPGGVAANESDRPSDDGSLGGVGESPADRTGGEDGNATTGPGDADGPTATDSSESHDAASEADDAANETDDAANETDDARGPPANSTEPAGNVTDSDRRTAVEHTVATVALE